MKFEEVLRDPFWLERIEDTLEFRSFVRIVPLKSKIYVVGMERLRSSLKGIFFFRRGVSNRQRGMKNGDVSLICRF